MLVLLAVSAQTWGAGQLFSCCSAFPVLFFVFLCRAADCLRFTFAVC